MSIKINQNEITKPVINPLNVMKIMEKHTYIFYMSHDDNFTLKKDKN